jgi:hypothetical protein
MDLTAEALDEAMRKEPNSSPYALDLHNRGISKIKGLTKVNFYLTASQFPVNSFGEETYGGKKHNACSFVLFAAWTCHSTL